MAAVLFALEKGKITFEDDLNPPMSLPIVSHIPMEIPWLEAFDKLPENIIRKELMKRSA